MSIIKFIVLGIVLIVIVSALLWFLAIPSYFQLSSNSSYNAPFTSLMLRFGMNGSATLDFGDTEYNFEYFSGFGQQQLSISTFIGGTIDHTPHNGDVYRDFGIETDVSKVASDYISDYIVFSVKPTVQNYMASLLYTEVNITLNHGVAVNISSGLTNETHEYNFVYVIKYGPAAWQSTNLEIQAEGNRTNVNVVAGTGFFMDVFNIEIKTFKVEPQYIVIYVKPLY